MSKKKRNKRTKGRSNDSMAASSRERVWSDIEEAFFASAPPDQAEPPTAAESFDDLLPLPSPREAATWSGRAIRPSVAAIALASVAILLGLTAVVFASLG